MRNTIELSGRILQLRQVPEGETVGYGGAWTARRASRIAIASLGYADGLLRSAGGSDAKRGTSAVIAGKRCPVAGNISMDLVCIDVTELAGDEVRRGDFATFIGEQIPLDDVAESAGTIGYEILTRLGAALPSRLSRHLRRNGWQRAPKHLFVRTAGPLPRAGAGVATPAANGIRSPRKASRHPAEAHARGACSLSSRSRANLCTRRGLPPASPNSTG